MKTKHKNIFKSFLALTLAFIMVLGAAPLSALAGVDFASLFAPKAEAANKTYGIYTYEVSSDNKVTITDCDESAKGAITIPSKIDGKPVTSIRNWAFQDCTGLTSITIPNSVTSIGIWAFGYCTGLTSINVASDNNYYSDNNGVLFNKKKTELIRYPEGKSQTSYTIPNSVTSIGDWAFCNCTGLTNITIPNSVTSIEDSAFSGCTGLTSITLGNSVTSIGIQAFEDCTGLISITIPNSVTSIGDSAFLGCTGLTSINVASGNNCYSDNNGVLFNKKKTELIRYPEGKSQTSYTIPNSVTGIGEGSFAYCTGLKSITIPDSVTSIGDFAFCCCTGLTSITIPNSVTSIEEEAFNSCTGLTSITIPNSVTSIGGGAFRCCTGLKSITIPDSVTSIGGGTFDGCTGLTSITIPDSVTSIGGGAFEDCTGLKDVYYTGSKAKWNAISIGGSYNDNLLNATIHYNGNDDSVLSLNYSELTVSNNVCPNLRAILAENSGYKKDELVWNSSNPNVAVVDKASGVVNPVCMGNTVITVSTPDKKHSASCNLVVQSAFCLTSPDSSVTSLHCGESAKYVIYLYDSNGNQLPIGSSTYKISGTATYDVISKKVNEKSIELELKAKNSGQIKISLNSEEPDTYNEFRINVYPDSLDYLADSVPVSDEFMETNFNRSDMTVEGFRYIYDESKDNYQVSMTVYNSSGASAALVVHKANGDIYNSKIITKHTNFPTDWGSFLGILGKGYCQGLTGDLYTYRSYLNSTKTEVSVEVPVDGYITLSNDVMSCKMAMAYNVVGICTEAFLYALKESKAVGDVSEEQSDEIAKDITDAILKSIPDKDEFLKDIMEKFGTGISDKLTPQIVCSNAEFAYEAVERMCGEAGKVFSDVFADAVWSVLKSNVKSAVKNIAMTELIKSGVADSTLPDDLKKAEVFFKMGAAGNFCNQIIYSTILNAFNGVTTIQFKRDGKDGFVAKDKLKVISDVIDEDTVLSHYVICDMNKKALVKSELEKEFELSKDSVVEIHEIALMKDGEKIGTEMQATVEIEIPAGMLPSSVKIYRRESNGKYTDMKAYPIGNGKMRFVTTHFSEYVIVGVPETLNITVEDPEKSIPVGGSYQLVAVAEPDGALLPDLVWTSSDPSVATVDENGLVTALSEGVTTISVTDAESNFYTEVQIGVVQVIDFGDGPTIKVGEKLIYTPVIQEGYVDYRYTWSSSDTSIVTVDPDSGELTGVKKGSATVTMNLVDENGNVVASNSFVVNVKSESIFKKILNVILAPFRAIINLFKKLFGK